MGKSLYALLYFIRHFDAMRSKIGHLQILSEYQKRGTPFNSKIFLFHHFRKIYLPKCAQLVMTQHRTI